MNFVTERYNGLCHLQARRQNQYGSYRVVESISVLPTDVGTVLKQFVETVYDKHIAVQTVATSLLAGLTDASN